jgi:hypothetical protein
MQSRAAIRAVKALLEDGVMADEWTRQHGEVRVAVPVEAPRGLLHSWFVPVLHRDLLVGFFELTPELDVRRYSSFQQREGSVEGCPLASDWIDVTAIRQKVARRVGAGMTLGEPYLSFDTYPSRLAWAVPVSSPEGGSRLMFVAGNSVFESRSGPASIGASRSSS